MKNIFRSHYLLSTHEAPRIPQNFKKSELCDWFLYTEEDLDAFTLVKGDFTILILGIFFDPVRPDLSSDEIGTEILDVCKDQKALFKRVQDLSGRFTLFVFSDDYKYCIGDASNLKEIIYGTFDEVSLITSSLKLALNSFDQGLLISPEKKKVVEDPIFAEKENMWYGPETVDDRFHKVMTNHYFDLKKWEPYRKELFKRVFNDETEIMDFVSSILRNTFKILTQRYKVLQPITGGWDSRILLSASRDFKDKIDYYVFQTNEKVTADIWIPTKLSEKLGFDFKVRRTYPISQELRDIFEKEFLFPRFLDKTQQIQYHFDHHYGKKIVNINGNGSEVFRFAYGYSVGYISFDMLMVHCKYWYKLPYFVKELRKWYDESKSFAKQNNIELLDLYYWEQRVGNWVANWQNEQSVAIEELTPFNNASLITSMLQVKPSRRRGLKYPFIRDMIEKMWPETLDQPFNPSTPFHKKITNKYGRINYLFKKFRQIIGKEDRKAIKA